jgi:hypothetical protein
LFSVARDLVVESGKSISVGVRLAAAAAAGTTLPLGIEYLASVIVRPSIPKGRNSICTGLIRVQSDILMSNFIPCRMHRRMQNDFCVVLLSIEFDF